MLAGDVPVVVSARCARAIGIRPELMMVHQRGSDGLGGVL
jgi:hypothetical protein